MTELETAAAEWVSVRRAMLDAKRERNSYRCDGLVNGGVSCKFASPSDAAEWCEECREFAAHDVTYKALLEQRTRAMRRLIRLSEKLVSA